MKTHPPCPICGNQPDMTQADSWSYDDVYATNPHGPTGLMEPRYPGWRRMVMLRGRTFVHIRDDFDVGDLPQVVNV